MRVKQRVKKLEDNLGGTSPLHFLMVSVHDSKKEDEPETLDQALERTLQEIGLTESDLGKVVFLSNKTGWTERSYCKGRDSDLIGYDALDKVLEQAAENISLEPRSIGGFTG